MGEYDASGATVAETIWLSPEVPATGAQRFGGGDGVGGYAPLAVATGSGASAALYWVHGNHMGVPLVTTNASGAVATPPAYTMAGFPGQTKTLSDIYYNRYRDYDSSLGRYIQADPIGLGGGTNAFLYANANPLKYTDPNGKAAVALAAAPEAAALCANPVGVWVCGGIAVGAAGYGVYKLWKWYHPDCPDDGSILQNRGRPRGYWPGDRGAEEWGRKNGVGKDAGRRKFHGIKQGDNPSRADDDYGVNPDTGDVVDPSGESVGNLND